MTTGFISADSGKLIVSLLDKHGHDIACTTPEEVATAIRRLDITDCYASSSVDFDHEYGFKPGAARDLWNAGRELAAARCTDDAAVDEPPKNQRKEAQRG